MWGLKTSTIPVIIGALGLIKKGIDKYINKIPGNIKIVELQKIACAPWYSTYTKEDTIHQVIPITTIYGLLMFKG